MMEITRVLTGIPGYDEMLGGGFLRRTANLVEGAPGTGKSTLGLQFILNGIVQFDEPGLVLTFEQFPQQYYDAAAAFGWDLPALEASGQLRVIMTSPEVSAADLQQVGGRLEAAAHQMGARRILVDSLSHFERVAPQPLDLRHVTFGFVNALKRESLTALFTRESPVLLGDGEQGEEDLAAVFDSVTLMRYVEMDSAIRRALLVLKLRGSAHATDIRQYEIGSSGIEVQAKFTDRQGILSGHPHRMAEAFTQAFVRK